MCAAQNGIRQTAVGIVQDDGADGCGKTVGLQIVGIDRHDLDARQIAVFDIGRHGVDVSLMIGVNLQAELDGIYGFPKRPLPQDRVDQLQNLRLGQKPADLRLVQK